MAISNNKLQERVNLFLTTLGVSVSNFTKNVGFSLATYYKWMSGERAISYSLQLKISNYLEQFGF